MNAKYKKPNIANNARGTPTQRGIRNPFQRRVSRTAARLFE
jgi:hypothetical protein